MDIPADLEKLTIDGAVARLTYVGDAITMMRHKLDGLVPLIGFTGAPWTLMGYMIEGGGSKTMSKAKAWLNDHPADSKRLLEILTATIVDYFEMQVKAGAQMLQVFESSADYISKEEFALVSLPYCRQIREQLLARLASQQIEPVPMVMYAKGGGHSLREQAELGYEVIGLDWTIDPVEARRIVGPNVTLQGNLDPQDLYKTAVSFYNSLQSYIFISHTLGRAEGTHNDYGQEVWQDAVYCKFGTWHYTGNTHREYAYLC